MLSQYIRVIHSDNASLSDKSLENQDQTSLLDFAVVALEDYYYIGQRLPVNNFFVQVQVPNASVSTLGIEYWDQTAWRNGVDILDGTSTAGVTLSKSGVVQFSPSSLYQWAVAADDLGGVFPTELSGLNITNVYWYRIKFSADIDALTTVKRIVYAFTTTQNVNSHDASIANFYTAFGAGKTNWDDEIVTASLQVARDLKRRAIIRNRGQILELEDICIPTEWKTLENIYRALGGDYEKKKGEAAKEYLANIDMESITLDKNLDGRVSFDEIDQVFGAVIRRS